MTKKELATKVSEQTGIAAKEVVAILDAAMATIKDAVKNDDTVTLRGFGAFSRKYLKEKKVQNISKGETMVMDAHYVPSFKAGSEFKAEVK